jgi:hypothetical protein
MQVHMNRLLCNCWQAACERTFGWRVEHDEWGPGGCVVETREDGRPEVTVLIKDRDGDKILTITPYNRAAVIDGWGLVARVRPRGVE